MAVIMFPILNNREKEKREKEKQRERIPKVQNMSHIQLVGVTCFKDP